MSLPQPIDNLSNDCSGIDKAFASSLQSVAGRIIADDPALAAEIVRQMAPARDMMGITARQRELLGFIASYGEVEDGITSSYDEMRSFMGLRSKSAVSRLIDALEERGLIRRLPNRARSIQIVSPGVGALGPGRPAQ